MRKARTVTATDNPMPKKKQNEGATNMTERHDPLGNISGIAYDMEIQIEDAIAIARTAQQRGSDDDEEGDCGDAPALSSTDSNRSRRGMK